MKVYVVLDPDFGYDCVRAPHGGEAYINKEDAQKVCDYLNKVAINATKDFCFEVDDMEVNKEVPKEYKK